MCVISFREYVIENSKEEMIGLRKLSCRDLNTGEMMRSGRNEPGGQEECSQSYECW